MTLIPAQVTFRGFAHDDALEDEIRERIRVEVTVPGGPPIVVSHEPSPRVYFNRASVLDDTFDDLSIGALVAVVEEPGETGPQASTIRLLGTHHCVAP